MKFTSTLTILIVLVFRYEFMTDRDRYDLYYKQDIRLCTTCFSRSKEQCNRFFNTIDNEAGTTPVQRFADMLPKMNWFRKRETRVLHLKNKDKIIAKTLARDQQYDLLANKKLTRSLLGRLFTDAVRVQDLQLCPKKSTRHFVDYMEKQYNNSDELTAWLYMLINVQPILNPYLYSLGFPVPKTIATCGFTTFQEHVGEPMTYFYHASFGIKLRIAIKLLQGVIEFSHGFDRFRLHITDLTADNVVYNVKFNKLYFVDLDSLLIVDAGRSSQLNEHVSVHKYEHIPCDNCFAYVQKDICEHQNSDFVIFQACQLLREDLRGDQTKGFLYPVPRKVKQYFLIWDLFIDLCVKCPSSKCKNRFEAAARLIRLYQMAIEDLGY